MGNGMDAHSYKFWNTSQVPALPGPIPDLGEVVSSRCPTGVGTRAPEVKSAEQGHTATSGPLEFGPRALRQRVQDEEDGCSFLQSGSWEGGSSATQQGLQTDGAWRELHTAAYFFKDNTKAICWGERGDVGAGDRLSEERIRTGISSPGHKF